MEAQERLSAEMDVLRHELRAIDRQSAWTAPASRAVMRRVDGGSKEGRPVPVSDRALARTMFEGIAAHHRWPRFRRMAIRLDGRRGVFEERGEPKPWIEPARACEDGTHGLSS